MLISASFALTSALISIPWIYLTRKPRSSSPSLPPPYRGRISFLLLIHTLYILYVLLVKIPPNIFSRLGIPIGTPAERIREILRERSGLEPDMPLPESVDLLLKRLGSFDLRILYVRFGHAVVQTCGYCQKYDEYALFALSRPLLGYIREASVIGAVTIQGSRRERFRVLGIGALISACIFEAYQISSVDIKIPRDGTDIVMWHDRAYLLRHVLFMILPVLIHILPASPPDLQHHTFPNALQTMNSAVTRIQLLKYVRGAVMRTPELREQYSQWWALQKEEGDYIRNDDAVKRVAEKEGLAFAEESGKLYVTAKTAAGTLMTGFAPKKKNCDVTHSMFAYNYSDAALKSLSDAQISFLHSLPKAELHAHLAGSIPINTLITLASAHHSQLPNLQRLTNKDHGVSLATIDDFFGLFPEIYEMTSTPKNLAFVTRAVLAQFLDTDTESPVPKCSYVELRSTPRATDHMTRMQYVETVLDEVELYDAANAALIVSLDRRMSEEVLKACVDVAITLKNQGRRVVGVDLCGDPLAGDVNLLSKYLNIAREGGLGLTVHIAETDRNTDQDTLALLGTRPQRLGHATFLSKAAREIVLREKMVIEVCLSSNLLCKTVDSISTHHIRYYLEKDHPIVICTDDTLPFRTTLLAEYALLLAQPPNGLGLSEAEVTRIAATGMKARFTSESS